jgi:hypothetical protein
MITLLKKILLFGVLLFAVYSQYKAEETLSKMRAARHEVQQK